MTQDRQVVLVVEDEILIRMHLRDVLEEAGYNVLEAGNAADALTLLEKHDKCAIVLSDIEMPGTLDGVALANKIYLVRPLLPIILMSGRKLPAKSALPPDTGFLAKPFPGEQLISLVRGALPPKN